MKRVSNKRKRLLAEAQAGRDAIRQRIRGCERCGKRKFALHEIPRAGVRSYVAGNPACVLGLCDPGCHQEVGDGWPKAKQLALLLLRRPDDFDLSEYNRWAVARVTCQDVAAYWGEVQEQVLHRAA